MRKEIQEPNLILYDGIRGVVPLNLRLIQRRFQSIPYYSIVEFHGGRDGIRFVYFKDGVWIGLQKSGWFLYGSRPLWQDGGPERGGRLKKARMVGDWWFFHVNNLIYIGKSTDANFWKELPFESGAIAVDFDIFADRLVVIQKKAGKAILVFSKSYVRWDLVGEQWEDPNTPELGWAFPTYFTVLPESNFYKLFIWEGKLYLFTDTKVFQLEFEFISDYLTLRTIPVADFTFSEDTVFQETGLGLVVETEGDFYVFTGKFEPFLQHYWGLLKLVPLYTNAKAVVFSYPAMEDLGVTFEESEGRELGLMCARGLLIQEGQWGVFQEGNSIKIFRTTGGQKVFRWSVFYFDNFGTNYRKKVDKIFFTFHRFAQGQSGQEGDLGLNFPEYYTYTQYVLEKPLRYISARSAGNWIVTKFSGEDLVDFSFSFELSQDQGK